MAYAKQAVVITEHTVDRGATSRRGAEHFTDKGITH